MLTKWICMQRCETVAKVFSTLRSQLVCH
jgi:hypothetical protein